MMDFCPKCGNLLIPAKDGKAGLECGCGYKSRGKKDIKLKESVKKKEEAGTGVADQNQSTLPVAKDEECPKCKNVGAYWWEEQTRAADEPATRFFRCIKCKHTWREYV